MKTKPALTLAQLTLLCLCVLLANNAWAEAPVAPDAFSTLDIESAVRLAVERNLSLERSRIESAAAKRKQDRSWNSLIPSLNAGVLAVRPTSIPGHVPPEADEWMPGFSLSASLQISPSIAANIRQAKEEYELGLLSYAAARQELEFQVRLLYYQILLLRANTELVEQNAASARSRCEQILVQRRTGQASNLDELSARLDVQTQEANARNAVTAYENALGSLKNLLMIPSEESIVPLGSLRNLQILSVADQNAEAGTTGEALTIGTLRKTISSLEAQRRGLRIGSYAPSLNLAWNSSPLYSGKINDWTDNNGQFSISLSWKLDNFFPGSQAREQIDSLDDAIALQENLLRENILNHQNTLRTLQRNIAQSLRTIETLRLNVALAGETRRVYEDSYQQGATDLQSLYSVRDNVSLAENQLLSEQYNLAVAILELEKELAVPFGTFMQ
ncbi:MAG: TolC family protein [Treponema sp.]|jgi:outer membrane protein|nr:TolC family protein [Treponema sp.]